MLRSVRKLLSLSPPTTVRKIVTVSVSQHFPGVRVLSGCDYDTARDHALHDKTNVDMFNVWDEHDFDEDFDFQRVYSVINYTKADDAEENREREPRAIAKIVVSDDFAEENDGAHQADQTHPERHDPARPEAKYRKPEPPKLVIPLEPE